MNSDPPLLSGTVPGLLDSSQSSRLLRSSGSTLFFAAFDPHTARASSFPNLSALHIDPESVPKCVNPDTVTKPNGRRIVVETDPESGTCSWRFVPRAKTETGLSGDEGSFPRLVELCGRLVRMTQDQWDLYKLDPIYDCVVRAHPNLTKITKVTSRKHPLDPDDAVTSDSMTIPKQDFSKTSSDSYSLRNKKFKSSTGPKRTVSTQTDSMSVDEDSSFIPDRAMPVTDQDVINNKKRKWDPDPLRKWTTSEAEKLRRTTPDHRALRDGYLFHLHSGSGGEVNGIYNSDIPAKKLRTRSPCAVRRELEKKRMKREMKRRAHMETRLKFRQSVLHQAFWDGMGIPSGWQNPGVYEGPTGMGTQESDGSVDESDNGSSSDSGSATDGEDEAQRLARIEESRRKLAELEKDRPLWEESARRRQARENEEEEMRQRAKKAKEEEERRQQQAQAARRQREEKREKERQEHEREIRIKEKRWPATFDVTKFSAGGTSLTFAAVPWPMLDSSFSVQDIEWDAVEKFFSNVRILLNTAEYKDLLEKSHKRFHPDRWRSRGLLLSVKDELEKDLLEVAGSTVAQAITPLWKNVTG